MSIFNQNGFTLAEVLITLGIIGVVAAVTMPVLIQRNNNRVVETRLQKFYSSINQAILLAESDYGDRAYWYQDVNHIDRDQEGNIINGSSVVEKWWKVYMAPYIKTIDIKYDDAGLPIFYFADGSALKTAFPDSMRDWYFYTKDPQKCELLGAEAMGRCKFAFLYLPEYSSLTGINNPNFRYHIKKGFEPYKFAWDGNINTLFNGSSGASYAACKQGKGRSYCTALIQYNGWKIPDNYPFKVSY